MLYRPVTFTDHTGHVASGRQPATDVQGASDGEMRYIKADKGYNGVLERLLPMYGLAEFECVKSNPGTNDFGWPVGC